MFKHSCCFLSSLAFVSFFSLKAIKTEPEAETVAAGRTEVIQSCYELSLLSLQSERKGKKNSIPFYKYESNLDKVLVKK